jgi:divalent metal cation (Fe/Co/Zn/Cd) transporter
VGSHDFVAHSYGPNQTMAMIDVEVPNDSDINEIHEIVDRIERDVLRETGVFLVIHTDPVELSDRRYLWCKRLATDVVKNLAPEADIHDFRVEESGDLSILSFDLVVPHSYGEEEETALAKQINEQIRKADARCNCEIHIEHGFVAEAQEKA